MPFPLMWRKNHHTIMRLFATAQTDANMSWTAQSRRADRYHRHLLAIYNTECTCLVRDCLQCRAHNHACKLHDDRCAACIAEHALFMDGDHDATGIVVHPSLR
jgi:hypothetical protein